MLYRFSAALVLSLHLLFVAFVCLGGLLVFWRRRLLWLHLPALIWGAALEFCGWLCPLTHLEVYLLRQGGKRGYPSGFIEQYLWPLIYRSRSGGSATV